VPDCRSVVRAEAWWLAATESCSPSTASETVAPRGWAWRRGRGSRETRCGVIPRAAEENGLVITAAHAQRLVWV
jgi:hypothetical protein